MSYAEKMGIKPLGIVYRFTQKEIDNLVKTFIKEKTGVDLDVYVGCLDEDFDVYIRWNADEVEDFETEFTEEQMKKIDELGLHPEEDFMNRDNIFQHIFDNQVIGYYYNDTLEEEEEEYYELTIM